MGDELTRDYLVGKISGLLSGSETRQAVSEWAFNIYANDFIEISDPLISHYLEVLGAVDTLSTDREYLYTAEDFMVWMSDLQQADSTKNGGRDTF